MLEQQLKLPAVLPKDWSLITRSVIPFDNIVPHDRARNRQAETFESS